MNSSSSIPATLNEALEVVREIENDIGRHHEVRSVATAAIRRIFSVLPLTFLPERLTVFSRKFTAEREGPRTGDGLTGVDENMTNLRMTLEETIACLSIPPQKLSPLAGKDSPAAPDPASYWLLGNYFARQCQAISAATDSHHMSMELFDRVIRQSVIGGMVEERDNNEAAAFLIRELRFQQYNDHFMIDLAEHPRHPGAGESLLRKYLGKTKYPIRMVLRENRSALQKTLMNHGFVTERILPKYFQNGDSDMDAHCMLRMPPGKLVQLAE